MSKWLANYERQRQEPEGERSPFSAMLGLRVVEAARGRVVVEWEPAERHMVRGHAQGGVLSTVADVAMAMANQSTLADEEWNTTVELKINFLRPVRAGERVRGTARVLRSGRTLSLVECQLTDAGGELVAHALSTCMTLKRPPVPPDA